MPGLPRPFSPRPCKSSYKALAFFYSRHFELIPLLPPSLLARRPLPFDERRIPLSTEPKRLSNTQRANLIQGPILKMFAPQRIMLFAAAFVLFVLLASVPTVSAGNVYPSGSRTQSPVPTETSAAPLCKKNAVQCCAAKTESNSTIASSIFSGLSLSVPGKVKELGINCTKISDEQVVDGFW